MNSAKNEHPTRSSPTSEKETDLNSNRGDGSCVSMHGELRLDDRDGRGGGGGEEVDEEVCSEGFLRRATGEEDLGSVRNLVLTVDTNVTQVIHQNASGSIFGMCQYHPCSYFNYFVILRQHLLILNSCLVQQQSQNRICQPVTLTHPDRVSFT